MPTFSIIVPVYKVEFFLHRCLKSILAQTFDDYEVILIDDGSPDNSGMICDEYMNHDSRICVIHKCNGGPSRARNHGIALARGKYVYFCDSDDFLSYRLLRKVYQASNGYDTVIFQMQLVKEDGSVTKERSNWNVTPIVLDDPKIRYSFLRNVFFRNVLWSPWNKIYSNSIIQKYGLRFEDSDAFFAEDLYFSFCYFLHCRSLVSIPETLYFYTQRSDSTMGVQARNHNFARYNEVGIALNKYIDQFQDKSIEEVKNNYPRIYYEIMNHAILSVTTRWPQTSTETIRSWLLAEVEDFSLFSRYVNTITSGPLKRELVKDDGFINAHLSISTIRYFCDGNIIKYLLDQLLLLPPRATRKIIKNIRLPLYLSGFKNRLQNEK